MPNRCFWRAHYTTQKIPPFFSVFQPTPSFSFSRWAPNLISSTRRGGGGRNQGGGGRNQSVRAAAGLPSIVCYHRGQVRQLPRMRLSLAPEYVHGVEAELGSPSLVRVPAGYGYACLGPLSCVVRTTSAPSFRRCPPQRPHPLARCGSSARQGVATTRPLIAEEQDCRRDVEISLDFAPLP
jgi:hypothetical protein